MAGTAPTSTDCQIYYKLQNNGTDELGNYNTTINGATYGAAYGIIDGAYDFDGTNDYLQTAGFTMADLAGFTSGCSFSLWANSDIVGSAYSQDGWLINIYPFFLYLNKDQDKVRFLTRDSSATYPDNSTSVYALATLTTGWHHYVGTYDATTGEAVLYIDGVKQGDDTSAGTGYTSDWGSSKLEFGGQYSYSGGTLNRRYWNGKIDEIAVFSVPLTQDNVTYLYNGGSPTSSQQYPFSGGGAGWEGKINGVDYSDIAKVNKVAKASIAKINGIEVSAGSDNPFNNHATLGTDCEAYYKLDSDATDSTTNGNDGTVNGATGGATGKIGDCYSFDGTNDYINTNISSYSVEGKSISLWFKTTDTSDMYLLGDGDISGDYKIFGIRMNWKATNRISIFFYSGTSNYKRVYYNFADTTDGAWHHLVLTVNDISADDFNLYIDGVDKALTEYDSGGTVTDFTLLNNLKLGVEMVGYDFYGGYIDEVGFFDTILTQDNVTYLYNGGSPTSSQQYPFSGGGAGWEGKIQGIDYSDIAKVNKVAKASIAKINGVDVT